MRNDRDDMFNRHLHDVVEAHTAERERIAQLNNAHDKFP
jgi:hypothetical protein